MDRMHQADYRIARTRAQDLLLKERHKDDGTWHCCDTRFEQTSDIYRHLARQHISLIEQDTERELELIRSKKAEAAARDSAKAYKGRRAEKYGSDPIHLGCSCDPSLGTVILFYAYLPINDPLALAQLQMTWSQDLGLSGKIKVATEGINATLAGPSDAVQSYIDSLTSLPEFSPFQLAKPTAPMTTVEASAFDKKQYDFFKPTPGCVHVFGGNMSIKVVDEICPLGAPELSVYHDPSNRPGKLSPRDFHEKLQEMGGREDVVVLDVRNYYESHVGHFPGAVKPPIRKFSSFRDYVDMNKEVFSGKTILSYCTGGIRCEKATSYLRKTLDDGSESESTKVLMLEGGIHNYLEWIKHEGRSKESLWLGRNYVFDARQSMGLDGALADGKSQKEEEEEQVPGKSIITFCQGCNVASARYVKCCSFGCHRLIVACAECSPVPTEPNGDSGMSCCDECLDMGTKLREYSQGSTGSIDTTDITDTTGLSKHVPHTNTPRVKRGICACERNRRIELGVQSPN
ncbi:hypothetical protein BGZ94_008438 [Podila epigama]|nr:hypothetical protein BGZ94_008438 [Podila epigama]